VKPEGNYGIIYAADEVLPWGWSLQRIAPKIYRIVTPPNPAGVTKDERKLGVIVPLAALIGTPTQQAAFAELEAWRASPASKNT
jgi:hypothetical protein